MKGDAAEKVFSRAGLFKARLRKPRISENFDVSFVGFSVWFAVYIVCPSVLSLCNLKPHKTEAAKNISHNKN